MSEALSGKSCQCWNGPSRYAAAAVAAASVIRTETNGAPLQNLGRFDSTGARLYLLIYEPLVSVLTLSWWVDIQ